MREAYAIADNAPEHGLKDKRGLPNQENNPPPTQKAIVQIFVPRIFRRESKSSMEEMYGGNVEKNPGVAQSLVASPFRNSTPVLTYPIQQSKRAAVNDT